MIERFTPATWQAYTNKQIELADFYYGIGQAEASEQTALLADAPADADRADLIAAYKLLMHLALTADDFDEIAAMLAYTKAMQAITPAIWPA